MPTDTADPATDGPSIREDSVEPSEGSGRSTPKKRKEKRKRRLVPRLPAQLASYCTSLTADTPEPSVPELKRDEKRPPEYTHNTSQVAHTDPACCCHRYPTTFQKELVAMCQDIKNGFNRLVLSKLSTRPIMTDCMCHLRLEYAIKELKPTPPDADFMNIYTIAAEKHCDDLLKKYQGDLETSQIFVSTFAFPVHLLPL